MTGKFRVTACFFCVRSLTAITASPRATKPTTKPTTINASITMASTRLSIVSAQIVLRVREMSTTPSRMRARANRAVVIAHDTVIEWLSERSGPATSPHE